MGNGNSGILMLGLLGLLLLVKGKNNGISWGGTSYSFPPITATSRRSLQTIVNTVKAPDPVNRIVYVNKGSIDKPVIRKYSITPQAERFVSPVPVLTLKSRSTARNVYQIR